MTSDEPFETTMEIAASPDVVWRALREPDQLKQWHGYEFDGLDDEVDYIYGTKATESGDRRSLTVDGGDTFTLFDADGRTIVRMTRAPRGTDPEWDKYYDDINEGWLSFMQQLRFALERHAGQARRTFNFSADGASGPAAALFPLVDGIAMGESYAVQAPTGERLTGQVWFRSDHQVGLTVDGWGDGLLIVGELPATAYRSGGGSMLIATAYGLDETTLDNLRTTWQRWWSEAQG